MTKLCVPLTADTYESMAREIDAAGATGADMIELRLDYLHDLNADAVRQLLAKAKQCDGQVIATCRIADEGGQYKGDEAERIKLLALAGHNEADYLDIEYAAWQKSAETRKEISQACEVHKGEKSRCKLILSKHDFAKTPADLDKIFAELAKEPCHIVKLACTAKTITDSLRMLEALRKSAKKRPTIAISMGETGVLTRVLAKKLGAFLTFAAMDAGKESAPGQLTISEMRSLYRWDKLKANTQVYGVIGCPVAHSMSPAIHNAAFDAIGYDGVYLPLRIEPDYESFAAFVDGCIAQPWFDLRGCSVTIPHKKNLLQYVEQHGGQIEPLAQRIGVANTLCIDDTQVSAFNTDYRGALDALCTGIGCEPDKLSDLSVAILGAGGVSRAIVAGLRDCGSTVIIYNRTGAKAKKLAEEFEAGALPWEERSQLEAEVVINCTSIGMWPNAEDTPLPAKGLSHQPAVFDTIYNPIETRLLREALERGCKTIDGASMFVNQAVAQFERWTSQRAPVEVMREVVIARLSE